MEDRLKKNSNEKELQWRFNSAESSSGDSEPNEHVYSSSSSSSRDDDDNDSSVSDCESGVTGGKNSGEKFAFSGSQNLVLLQEGDRFRSLISRRFVASLGPEVGPRSTVVAIHRNSHSSAVGRARLSSFQIFARAVAEKCGGDANVRYAWFAPSSPEEISPIFSHGFFARVGHSPRSNNNNGGLYGLGLYLSPDDSPPIHSFVLKP